MCRHIRQQKECSAVVSFTGPGSDRREPVQQRSKFSEALDQTSCEAKEDVG
jgi:hypothetical protein